MGQNSRQRREARRRAMARPARPAEAAPRDDPATARAEVVAAIDLAVRLLPAPRALAPRVDELNRLGSAASDRGLDPAVIVVDEVMARLSAVWENGWQPLDLVHATRRRADKAAAQWVARAVLVDAERSSARDRAPDTWASQVEALAERHGTGAMAGEVADDLLTPRGHGTTAQWSAALGVLHLLRILPPVQHLVPPPSQWGRQTRSRPAARSTPLAGEQRAKMLTKVRSLLAKAESTEFVAEAEAFTAKAQDLMTRHSIDEALLAADAGAAFDVQGVRVLVDNPYALEKATLLHVVAEANRVRAVWNEFASCVTLVGLPTDVGQVDLLFTSTLVQATRAMTRADLSTAPFRRAFLHAFAVRIGERLTASAEEVVTSYGSSLVPVLQRKSEAIDDEVDRLFPQLTSRSSRRRFDARGWEAGTQAADAAVLPAGEVGA